MPGKAAAGAAARVAPAAGPSVTKAAFQPAEPPVPAASAKLATNAAHAEDAGQPRSVNAAGVAFTTSLVFPDAQVNQWPYVAAGRLFFVDGGKNYACSASLVGPRLVATAAHCIYNTAANRWHTNFLFIPAYNAALTTQPFGRWTIAAGKVAPAWITGAETYPNANDYGLLETVDQAIAGQTRKVGAWLGYFGWQTNAVVGRNLTELGYPSNLGSGKMVQTNSTAVTQNRGVNAMIGSAMWKGASGGPWIQDFGRAAPGQAIVSGGANTLVAVTSYVSMSDPNPGPQYNGATVLGAGWANLYKAACARRAGNCD